MSSNNVCPSCGAALESDAGSSCPFCGSALSAPTMISAPASEPVSPFNSSAEVMDEVKRLLRQDDKNGAIKVYREHFKVEQAEAKDAVEIVDSDLRFHSAPPVTPPVDDGVPDFARSEAPAAEPVINSNPFDEPKKPSGARGWIIGGSIAAVVFLCLCCCLPIVLLLVSAAQFNR